MSEPKETSQQRRSGDRLAKKAIHNRLLIVSKDFRLLVSTDHNDIGRTGYTPVGSDQGSQLDAVHTRHLPIQNQQFEGTTLFDGCLNYAKGLIAA